MGVRFGGILLDGLAHEPLVLRRSSTPTMPWMSMKPRIQSNGARPAAISNARRM